jgi:hypothetical protein
VDKMTPAEAMAFAQQHGLPEGTTDVFGYVQGWLRGYRLATGIWQRSDEILPTVQQPQQAPITAQIEAPKVWANGNKTNGNKALTKPLVPDSARIPSAASHGTARYAAVAATALTGSEIATLK